MKDLRYQDIINDLILEELGNGKQITLRVSGKSMYPLIQHGDSIRIVTCAPGLIAIGDIITFNKRGIYFTHRVLWKTKKGNRIGLITKGDNEVNPDPPVSPDHILGKVVVIGRVNRSLHLETPLWRFMSRLLGFLFLLEMASIFLYRFSAGRFHPPTVKFSLLYRHLRNRSLNLATRIIMQRYPPPFPLEL